MTAIFRTFCLCSLAIVSLLLTAGTDLFAAGRDYQQIVVLGDPHLPGKNLAGKQRVVETVNSWGDVDAVVALGDITETCGTEEEYVAAKAFFAKLAKPFFPVTGNHDFIYADSLDAKGKRQRGGAEARQAKLERFRRSFGLETLWFSREAGRYRLIFLSLDAGGALAELSQRQLEWLKAELEGNRSQPTIIFCHAPLYGTLENYNKNANTPNFVIQPELKIRDLLMAHPQVFLWVSGHTHTSPKEASFASSVNLYEKQITNIHNTDMNRTTIWTNSLFLRENGVTVRTFDHGKGTWLPRFDRTVALPKL